MQEGVYFLDTLNCARCLAHTFDSLILQMKSINFRSFNFVCVCQVKFTNNALISVIYSSFSISNESTQFTLSVSGYVSNGFSNADAFLSSANSNFLANGMGFSTPDRDNDKCTCNCAQEISSGWWFGWCSQSYLNADGYGSWIQIETVASSRMTIKHI